MVGLPTICKVVLPYLYSVRNKYLLFIAILIFQFLEIKSQCYKFVSPKPLCTRVLDNGDLNVYVSLGSIGAGAKPEIIDRIELEHSVDGQFFNAVSSVTIGVKWPMPLIFSHIGANAQSQTGVYRTVAYCDTANNYALPVSEIVKSIKLDYLINNDNNVELNWNWDTVAENMLQIVYRKPYMDTKWDSVGSPAFLQGHMSFTDSSLIEADTLTYRIDFINLDKLCQGNSSQVTFIYQPISKPTGINEIEIEKLKIWPNPTKSNLNISYKLVQNQELSIDIYNSLGQQVKSIARNEFQSTGNHLLEINLPSDLKQGIYLVRFSSMYVMESLLFEYSD